MQRYAGTFICTAVLLLLTAFTTSQILAADPVTDDTFVEGKATAKSAADHETLAAYFDDGRHVIRGALIGGFAAAIVLIALRVGAITTEEHASHHPSGGAAGVPGILGIAPGAPMGAPGAPGMAPFREEREECGPVRDQYAAQTSAFLPFVWRCARTIGEGGAYA